MSKQSYFHCLTLTLRSVTIVYNVNHVKVVDILGYLKFPNCVNYTVSLLDIKEFDVPFDTKNNNSSVDINMVPSMYNWLFRFLT